MNFKDSYQQENEQIHPDKAFIDKLALQMEAEKQKKPSHKKIIAMTGTFAAVAAAAVVALYIGNPMQRIPMQEMTDKAETSQTQSQENDIAHEIWYGEAKTDEEIFAAFQKLLNEETIKTLYCSDVEEWNSEDIMLDEEAKLLIGRLSDAEKTADKVSGSGMHYMAVFESGRIVKFHIYEGQYLKLKESDIIYIF